MNETICETEQIIFTLLVAGHMILSTFTNHICDYNTWDFKCLQRVWQSMLITRSTRTWALKGYRGMLQFLLTALNRSHLALSNLTFKYYGEGETRECSMVTKIYIMIFRNVSLCLVDSLLSLLSRCFSHFNPKQETSAWSQKDSSLCHFLFCIASNLILILSKGEGSWDKKI